MSEFRSPEQVLSTTALPLQATSASTPGVAASIPDLTEPQRNQREAVVHQVV